MIDEAKQFVASVITSVKAGYFTVLFTSIEVIWLKWGAPVLGGMVQLLSVILLIVLIRYHLANTKKINIENKQNNNNN